MPNLSDKLGLLPICRSPHSDTHATVHARIKSDNVWLMTLTEDYGTSIIPQRMHVTAELTEKWDSLQSSNN